MSSIAVLLTCFNRVTTTLECLEHLYLADLPEGFSIDIFLVDDNSPDLTGAIVKERYPMVNIINGTGSLYWNRGMRLAWDTASKKKDYDFYLWLNDDTFILPHSLTGILNDYSSLKKKNIEALLLGPCYDPVTKSVTYSGSINGTRLKPLGFPQQCCSIVGNFLLVSKEIFSIVGNLDDKYSHAMGDIDYGLRAKKNGYKLYITSHFIGSCSLNENIPWYDPSLSFTKRRQKLFSITGGNYKEYIIFKKTHFGLTSAVLSVAKTLIRLTFPKLMREN